MGIKDKKLLLTRGSTKDSLTLYLSHQPIRNSTVVKVMTETLQEVKINYECKTVTDVSTEEEADILMIYHAVEVAGKGMNAHIYYKKQMYYFLPSEEYHYLATILH